jgi:nitrate reductase gamma subunit
MAESIYFIVFPYIAIVLAFGVGIYRYSTNRFSYSSMSSQFLENRALFWGSVPWHYGIVLILLAHVQAAVLPRLWVSLHANPYSMFVLGLLALTLGVLAVIGLIILILRRIVDPKARVVTTVMDWILLADLLLQVTAGLYISLFYRWGSLWYVYTATPWLASLATLSPRIDPVTHLPWIVRFHMVNAFVVIGLFPFTRLVHIFTVPFSYLWRPYQVAIWNNELASKKDEMKIETKGGNREVG